MRLRSCDVIPPTLEIASLHMVHNNKLHPHRACTQSWSWHQCCTDSRKQTGSFCIEQDSNPHSGTSILTIRLSRLLDSINLPTPTCTFSYLSASDPHSGMCILTIKLSRLPDSINLQYMWLLVCEFEVSSDYYNMYFLGRCNFRI